MIRILLVDDHPAVRDGLRRLLAGEPDLIVGGEAGNAREALALVRTQEWGLVVLDISLPDRCGLDLLKELRRDHPKLPVLILSMHAEEMFAAAALKEGAAGYLTKDRAPHELLAAIRRAAGGGKDAGP